MRTFLLTIIISAVAMPAAAQRLPAIATPDHYTLWFAPNLEQATFRGRETISVSLAEPSTTITLNAAEITFDTVTIEDAVGSQTARVTLREADEMATLTVPRAIARGSATIHMSYTGILNDKLRGFYLSTANGRRYAVSQMEATDARRAFPGFDEPAYKATFDITLMIDDGDSAISNGPQVSDTPGPKAGKHTVVFARTPKMSTYLVALLVGDFVCRSGEAAGTPIRVCSTPDKLGLTAFALRAAEQQVAFFDDYFGIPYPYEKLDIIGVPDFAAGAMENAGAITFRERMLLADETTASVDLRKSVASVTAHEIAHQWFGDLVTMAWWDDIWLNEGFATWAANKPLAAWRPQWKMDVNVATETQTALGFDTLRATHPIHFAVETPAEINEVFDRIAYEKTAGVLAMIEAYVGAEPFRQGVSSYLSKHALGNATGEDFWTEMTRVTHKPVDRIMRSFVDQAGAPLLTVRSACVGGSTQVSITQERFVAEPEGDSPSTDQKWILPVCVKTEAGPATCSIVAEPRQTVQAPDCGTTVVNADARGYYITQYDPATVSALATRTPPLTPAERVSLLGDEWRMVQSGRHEIGIFLDLAAAFAGDETPDVVRAMAGRLGYVADSVAGETERGSYDAWLHATFRPALDAIGITAPPADADETMSRRGTLLRLLGADTDLQQRARELADEYLARPSSLAPALVGPILQVAAEGGDATLYDRYVARMKASTAVPEEYYRFFNALPAFGDPTLVQRTLELALSPEVRSQDAPLLIARLLGSGASQEAAWAWVQAHWPALMNKLDPFEGIPTVVGGLGGFCSADHAEDVKAFFDEHPVPAAARALQQALERITTCADLKTRQAPAFERWLAARD